MNRRQFLYTSVLAGAGAAIARPGPVRADQTEPPYERPSVVMIVTDDQDYGMGLHAMPKTRARMAAEPGWTEFTQAFANQAICAPSRSTMLTGRYPHQHGVTTNKNRSNLDTTQTLATWLQAGGYATAHYGKWLWGSKRPASLPGFDVVGGGSSSDGLSVTAADYIRHATGPFFLVLAGTDPHKPAKPAPRYQNADVVMAPLPPKLTDFSDKPAWLRPRGSGNPGLKNRIGCYRETLAIDDMVDTVCRELQAAGRYDNTLIVFASDNGFSWGSNGVGGKNAPYDPSIHVPLFVHWPTTAGPMAGQCDHIVSAVDIPATVLSVTGAAATLPQMGHPLQEAVIGTGWTDAAYIYGYEDSRRAGWWRGVRTQLWTYVEHDTGERELYDLSADPWQHVNLAGREGYADVLLALSKVVTEAQR